MRSEEGGFWENCALLGETTEEEMRKQKGCRQNRARRKSIASESKGPIYTACNNDKSLVFIQMLLNVKYDTIELLLS